MRPTQSVAPKVTGYVLYESINVVVIATLESENGKTGNMIQVWILYRHESPVDAVRNGMDAVICFDCKHRGTDGFKNRVCYVNIANAPSSVWDAYQAGKYPKLRKRDYARVFGGREVRFGAYGDPVLIPLTIVRAIVRECNGHTGYTHQWLKTQYAAYRLFLMASVDSMAEYATAKRLGWRTFRVRKDANVAVLRNEINCPASDEAGKRTQCQRCKLCSGNSPRMQGVKDIVIIAHGAQRKNFVSIDSLIA